VSLVSLHVRARSLRPSVGYSLHDPGDVISRSLVFGELASGKISETGRSSSVSEGVRHEPVSEPDRFALQWVEAYCTVATVCIISKDRQGWVCDGEPRARGKGPRDRLYHSHVFKTRWVAVSSPSGVAALECHACYDWAARSSGRKLE
jgi:hypothetical protein